MATSDLLFITSCGTPLTLNDSHRMNFDIYIERFLPSILYPNFEWLD